MANGASACHPTAQTPRAGLQLAARTCPPRPGDDGIYRSTASGCRRPPLFRANLDTPLAATARLRNADLSGHALQPGVLRAASPAARERQRRTPRAARRSGDGQPGGGRRALRHRSPSCFGEPSRSSRDDVRHRRGRSRPMPFRTVPVLPPRCPALSDALPDASGSGSGRDHIASVVRSLAVHAPLVALRPLSRPAGPVRDATCRTRVPPRYAPSAPVSTTPCCLTQSPAILLASMQPAVAAF